ncbi:MAG TPA: hypothetical protein VMW94_00815 [Actinomycetes bacterium]|nr:hypothetical protein [Actinomycetes bacterium]
MAFDGLHGLLRLIGYPLMPCGPEPVLFRPRLVRARPAVIPEALPPWTGGRCLPTFTPMPVRGFPGFEATFPGPFEEYFMPFEDFCPAG